MKTYKFQEFQNINENLFTGFPNDIQRELIEKPLVHYRKHTVDETAVYFIPKRENQKALVKEVNKFLEELGFKFDFKSNFQGEIRYTWKPGSIKIDKNIRVGVRTTDDIRMDMFDIMKL